MSHDDIIEKLTKLMAKEENCRAIGNVEEAAVYAAKIAEWCLRYKIELSTISTEAEKNADIKGVDKEIVRPGQHGCRATARVIWWQPLLLRAICDCAGCEFYLYKGSNAVAIIGKAIDRAMATFLYTMLIHFIETESQKQYDRHYYTCVEKGGCSPILLKGYRTSWIEGALGTLTERLKAMQKTLVDEVGADTVALVLRNDKALAKKWMDTNVSGLKNTTTKLPSSIHNSHGYTRGKEAAKRVSLQRPLETGGSRKGLKG